MLIIHQIFALGNDCYKCDILVIFPNLRVLKTIRRIMNKIAYLSLVISVPRRSQFFSSCVLGETVRFSQQRMFTDKYPGIFSSQMEAIVCITINLKLDPVFQILHCTNTNCSNFEF